MTHFRILLLAGTVLAGPAIAQELPTGAAVSAGTVDISTPGPGAMNIDQSSQSAIVNWQSFSVGKGGSVNIAQPNSQSVILNRVTGTADTSIAGQINANGQVFIVNPNGIAITPSGAVKTGGFVGSTLGITDSDFLSGHYVFNGNGASAPVSNAGDIAVTSGGYAALIGGHVSNSGVISAPLGNVGLGAGEQATLDLSGDGFLEVTLPSDFSDQLISQSGTIRANGGRVVISAAAAQDAARRVVNLSGVVEARTVSGRSGAIVLGGGGGAVRVSGRLDVSARPAAPSPRPRPAARGGSVVITGGAVDLAKAIIDASGADGGGEVRIGGDFHGAGPLPNAQIVSVDAATAILADATVAGNGGSVVLWSDATTDFAGKISARGAGPDGTGGNVEVSSKDLLTYRGLTDLSAPSGSLGTLLLDPYNIAIEGPPISPPGPATDNTGAPSFTPTDSNSIIYTDELEAQLALSNVTISTAGNSTDSAGYPGTQPGNIGVLAEVDWTAPTTLTLNADNDINLDAGINAPAGTLNLTAGNNIVFNAADVPIGVAISVGSGGMTATAASIIDNDSVSTITSAGEVTLSATSITAPLALSYLGSITSTASAVSLTSAEYIEVGNIDAAGFVSLVANGPTGNAGIGIDGVVTAHGGDVQITTADVLTIGAGGSINSPTAAVIIDAGEFTNASGAAAITAGSRFLVFTDDWSNDTRGGLGGSSRYGIAYDTGVPATIPGTDNEFISDAQPTLTVTIPDGTRTYFQALAPVPSAIVTGLVNGDTVEEALGTDPVATDTTAISAVVGTYANALQVSGVTSPIGYIVNVVFGSITVDPAALLITANDLSKTYGQAVTFGGTEFTTAGLEGADTVDTVTLTSTGAGAAAAVDGYDIVPSDAIGTGLGNYDITYDDGTLTVNPAPLTITADDLSKTYGLEKLFAGTEFTTAGLLNDDNIASVTLTSTGAGEPAVVGSYDIVASGATGTGLGNYDITYDDGTLTVNPAPLTITADDLSKTYGVLAPPFNGTEFTTAGLVNDDNVASVALTSAGAGAAAAVGPYDIVASGAIGTGLSNYDITYQDGTLTVNPAPLTITADDLSKTYGQTVVFSGTEFTTAGLVNGDTVAAVSLTSTGAAAAATVGPYAIVASGATGAGLGNYDIAYQNGTLTVTPAPLTITADDLSKTYGVLAPPFNGTEFTTAGLVNDDTVGSVTLSSTGAGAAAAVGPYDIVASGATGTGLGNYDITYDDGTLTVNPAPLTITADDLSKTYGVLAPPFNGTEFTTAGLVNDDNVASVTLTSAGAGAAAAVGPYDIVASGAIGTGLSNYDITYQVGTLTVDPAPLTITADDLSKTYGQTAAFSGTEFTAAGLLNGDTVSSVALSSPGAGAAAAVGSYGIDPSGAIGTGLGNYDIAYDGGFLTVIPASLLITADNLAKTYGQTLVFDGTEFTAAGLVNADTVGFVTLTSAGAGAAAAVGNYGIAASGATGTGLGNYDITYHGGTLAVAFESIGPNPSIINPTITVPVEQAVDTLPDGLQQPITQQDAKLSLQILQQRTQDFENKINKCQQMLTVNPDSSAFIKCEADALDQYADMLEDPLIKLPPELQATVGVIRQTVQRLRSAATMGDKRAALAQAHIAVQSLVNFVRQQTQLVRAVDPETQMILAQHGAVMTGALEHLDLAMVSAVGV